MGLGVVEDQHAVKDDVEGLDEGAQRLVCLKVVVKGI